MAIDELDRRILADLQADARTPFRTIAEKQGVSIGTVHNRLKRMLSEGTIKGFVPVLDDQAMGYEFKAIASVRVEGGHVDEVRAAVKGLEGIEVAWQVSGASDLVLVARFKDMKGLQDFTASIARIQHAKAETNLVMGSLVDASIITKHEKGERHGNSNQTTI
jgi:DNA-binding Lrp family transcriptional regulator